MALPAGPRGWWILRYLRLLVIPYGFTIDPEIGVPAVWLGLAAWAALLGAIVLALRRRETWSSWLLAGFILLIPSSSLFPAADLAADRRMYFPVLAFAAAAGLLLERVRPQAIAAVAVVMLTLVSVARTQVWMTEESLWREAVSRAPDKLRPRIQLARALPAAAALEVLAQARNLAPERPPPWPPKQERRCSPKDSPAPHCKSLEGPSRSSLGMPATSTIAAWRWRPLARRKRPARISSAPYALTPPSRKRGRTLAKLSAP